MNRPICAITGATGGIGAALARQAARQGYDLVLHGRGQETLSALCDQLKCDQPGLNVQMVVGDLSTAAGARDVAAAIADQAPELALLFNNAGVLLDGIQMSPDGVEMHAQVNLIAPYILMQSLKPNIAKAKGVIVNVSSGSAFRAKTLSVEELRRPHKAQKLTGAYARSKLALSVVAQALGKSFVDAGVTIASADPGPNKTGMTSGDGMPALLLLLRPLIYASPEKGAARVFETSKAARSHPQLGAFFSGRRAKKLPNFAVAQNVAASLIAFCDANAGLSGVD